MALNKRRRLAEEAEEKGERYFDLGEYQAAADMSLQAATFFKGLKGADPAYAIARARAGMAFCQLKEYPKAIKLLEEALSIFKQAPEDYPEALATCHDYLGLSYKGIRDYVQAEKHCKTGLEIREKYKNEKVVHSLNNLGNIYLAEDKYDLAKPLFEQALAILEEHEGQASLRAASPLNNLAIIYHKQGEYDKAGEYFERALGIRAIYSDDIFVSNYLIQKQRLAEEQEKFKEAERLAYLGNMATGIAHNINNPTNTISLKARRGLRRVEAGKLDNQEALELFKGIIHEVERLAGIIKKFQNFARGDRDKRENVNLNDLARRVAAYFEGQFQSHEVALTLELPEHDPQAYANQFMVEEVLINLLSNARESVEKQRGAAVWLKTGVAGEHGLIRVEDNGPGIPEQEQKNLFLPFHSTKPHGTGLGLHFAKSALERINGTIAYQDRPGGGACFTVHLLAPQGETDE